MDTNTINPDSIRTALFDSYNKQYRALLDFFLSLPLPQNLKHITMHHFDTAFLWSKEAFSLADFSPLPSPSKEAEKEITLQEVVNSAA